MGDGGMSGESNPEGQAPHQTGHVSQAPHSSARHLHGAASTDGGGHPPAFVGGHPPAFVGGHVMGGAASLPTASALDSWSDAYFLRTRSVIEHFGDQKVTYAVFMRRPVICAPRLALEWLAQIMAERRAPYQVEQRYAEGKWVGAGEPMLYITGSFKALVDTETLLLQKLGPACVAAANAFSMCADLPKVAFLAMDARHCAGIEMADLMAYAAAVGSQRAQRKIGALGFIGNASNATAQYFGQAAGLGTMPHALIGYAGSTVRAAEFFHATHPEHMLTILVDYFAREYSDAVTVCQRFPDLAQAGKLAVRLDTLGGRFVEGLDPSQSYALLERHAPRALRGYRNDADLAYLIGPGVSAAAIWRMREVLDQHGFTKVNIVASSGFSPAKCRMMAEASAPIDIIGTGSFLPDKWSETYATADIIAYNGVERVKVGREFLLRKSPPS
jgi:nicotinate phosphoribosyltransferase